MKIYISHAVADKAAADKLAQELRARGQEVLHPFEDIEPGDNWHKKIGQALEEAKAMIVLLSPNSSKSSWVQKEVEYALTASRFSGRLIPVMLQPTADYPWIFKKLQMVRFNPDAISKRLKQAPTPTRFHAKPVVHRVA